MANIKTITVPDIGDFNSVDVIEVLVSPGDLIKAEDALITLESDKATMDIPAPEAGVIKTIIVKSGDKVAQGDPILELEVEAEEKTSTNTASMSKKPEITLKEVRVPDIGDFSSVDVIEILVSPGDQIAKEAGLITLESDKATMDIPAPEAGTVKTIAIQVGDKVAQGDLILTLESSGITSAVEQPVAPKAERTPLQPAQKSKPAPTPVQTSAPQVLGRFDENRFGKAHASPAVRKFARELGVELSKVSGSGRKGRILKEDVQAYIKSVLSSGASPGIYVADLPEVDFKKFGEIEIQALSKINKLTGKFLHRSWFYIPHVTQFDEADITELDDLRKRLSVQYQDQGVKITFLAFLLKAVVATLQAFPRFNASLDNEQENLILKKYFHLGIAVDTPEGLVVPVIRDVNKKTLVELAGEVAAIAVRAREKKITPAEMQGACFTISSQGGIGGTGFTPIVNQPEVAILGVSKMQIKPAYIDNAFVPRKMLPLSLSYDHRVIDGAAAAKFTTHLADILSTPEKLVD